MKKLKREIDWEFIKHTILIVTRSFRETNEIMEILKQEGIFKGRKQKGKKKIGIIRKK